MSIMKWKTKAEIDKKKRLKKKNALLPTVEERISTLEARIVLLEKKNRGAV